MVHGVYLKCEVCGSVIATKVQVGYLSSHPIRINCAKCGILISGHFFSNQKEVKFGLEFKNAIEVYDLERDPDYFIHVAGELLTQKIQPYSEEAFMSSMTPFMINMSMMKAESNDKGEDPPFVNFTTAYNEFIRFKDYDWLRVRRINELWLSKKYEYLKPQLQGFLPKREFPTDNLYEYLRTKQMIQIIKFSHVLPKKFHEEISRKIMNEFSDIGKKHANNFRDMIMYFGDSDYLHQYEHHIFDMISIFVEKYEYFIPAIGLKYYSEEPDFALNGTTAVSFEDVKSFYVDMYEVIGNMLNLVIAFNNLKYRDDFNSMKPNVVDKIETLDDFIKMRNKGRKIEFCFDDEIFTTLINLNMDNKLRNAIGHASYRYDGVNQIIEYFSSGTMGKGESIKIYLMEFIQRTLSMFETILLINELVYQTKKFHLIYEGILPTYRPE